jgi:hypothetical protein
MPPVWRVAGHAVRPAKRSHCPGLSIGQDNGLADKDLMSSFERVQDRRRAKVHNWHGLSRFRLKEVNADVALERRASSGQRTAIECPAGTLRLRRASRLK